MAVPRNLHRNRLVGNGAAHLAYSRSISTWFQRRLGVALALVMVGAGLGVMLLPVFCTSGHQPSELEDRLCFSRLHLLAIWAAS